MIAHMKKAGKVTYKYWQLVTFFVMLWIFIGYTTELLLAMKAAQSHITISYFTASSDR